MAERTSKSTKADDENVLPIHRDLGTFVGTQADALPASEFVYKTAKSETVLRFDEISQGMAYIRRLNVSKVTAFDQARRLLDETSHTQLLLLLGDPEEKVDPYDPIWEARAVEHLTPEGVDDPFGSGGSSGS